MESHLLQMRGLKLGNYILVYTNTLSHLLQMRGLKPMDNYCKLTCRLSHLLQMRGLKPSKLPVVIETPLVASFTDAWIETNYRQKEHQHH